MSALIVYSSDLAEVRGFSTSCDFDKMSLKGRVEQFAKHHNLDAEKIGEWSDYPLRDWIASTDHVLTWVYLTRFLGQVGRILALKVGCLAARRALVFWENEGGGRSEPREVIEYVEKLVKKYEAGVKKGSATVKGVKSLRSSAYDLAMYVQNDVAFPMSIPAVARAGSSVIERLGIAAGEDEDDCYCLAEGIMAALIEATEIYESEYVQNGLVYTKPKSAKSDQYKAAEQARQRADFLAVLDEIEGVTASKPEQASP